MSTGKKPRFRVQKPRSSVQKPRSRVQESSSRSKNPGRDSPLLIQIPDPTYMIMALNHANSELT